MMHPASYRRCPASLSLSILDLVRLQLRESLEGSQAQAQIDFECTYEAYDTEASPASQTLSPPRDRDRFQSQLSASPQSSPGQSKRQSSDMGGLGILSVRIIAAYNLVNADTGILGDVSDPYVTVRLESQSEKQRKRTHTINNDLNPKWNSSPFLFPIQQQGGRWQPFSLNSWVSLPPHLPERCTSLAQASRRPATPGGLRRGHDGL